MGSPTELGSVPNIRPVTQRKFIVFGEGKRPVSLFFSTLQLFVSPTHIIVTIAATRVHRALVDFTSGSSDVYDTLTSFSSSLSRLVRPLPF